MRLTKQSNSIVGLVVVAGFLAACSTLPTVNPSTPLEKATPKAVAESENFPWAASRVERKEYMKRLVSQRKPYTGSVTLRVVPGLNQSNTPSRTLTLASNTAFGISSLPSGLVVFQEHFSKGEAAFDAVRAFRVLDTSKRYTLHVQKDAGVLSNIAVNLNGTDWISSERFTPSTQDSMQEGLLLNANNSLRIRMNGIESASVTITVVEVGESGTILQKIKDGFLDGDSQAKHVASNDTNIFNPADPGSLGSLQPYQGERVDGSGSRIGAMRINGQGNLEFQSAVLILELPDAQNNLTELRRLYGAEILDQMENRYLLKVAFQNFSS